MKNLKFLLFSMLMALFVVTSCTNDEPVDAEEPTTEDSQSITSALGQLRTQFDANGNVTQTDNPAGNIVLDFCFDFVYPLTLSYNNGTTVTVEDLDGLISVLISSTNDLYISGIAFPFDVETFDDDSNSIEIETIENEAEFIELLLSCDFDDDDIDECYEVYDPVCVAITDPNGETFVVTYPNACYAEYDGFDDDDFLDDCADDYYNDGFDCFDFNFPISVVTEGGTVITLNSEEELATALYDVYVYDFVYPFSVTVYDDGEAEVETIEDAEDLEDIIEDCYDDYYDDDDDYFEDCEMCEDEPFDPVCIEYEDDEGNLIITVFPNMCFAECVGFTENNVVECENDNSPSDCTEEDIADFLVECEWYAFSSLSNNEDFEIHFNADGTLIAEVDDLEVSGTWEVTATPIGNVMSFNLSEPLGAISGLDWTIIECSENYILLVSNEEFIALERDCD